MHVEEVILVWNADAGLRGHLGYAMQKLRSDDTCTLCALTHGSLTEKPEWKACKRGLGVPIEAVYRNRLSQEQTRVVDGEFPCVIARTPENLVKLMGRDDIDSCRGDLDLFVERLRTAIAAN